ncbi:SPFH domain-containing protein [Leptolyngbya sp. FACHB-261]|uniref:SPFH domain-containing protein n=1 Tax=Leptolyngbya sp. FACHB-261 TaxID=2692806 RepID=UPI00168411AF|nr:SPFH domain-containing protein [Leptolyngbya sp. FACHB-261]MBD2104404.1 SPFH domain-containing protein [Leptolyngbya sp. FACHB-261]
MGIIDKIRCEFVDIIEWLDPTNDTMAYRFERFQNEIKRGSKLTVRPGQMAVLVNEGRIADVFAPGLYPLSTQNLPILSTLMGWSYGFNSPFKAEVYFFSTRTFTNLKWGTSNPVIVRDPELGPVRLRGYGTYGVRVAKPEEFLQQLIATDGLFQVNEISGQIRNLIVTQVATWLGRSNIPLLDFAAHYSDMGETIRAGIQPELDRFGLEVTQLLIENISLPAEVEAALDKRTSMGLLGDLQQYAQFQAANAIETAAKNPGGGNSPLEFGVGLAMGQQMVAAMQPKALQPLQPVSQPQAAPPPPVPSTQWYLSRDGQNFGPFAADQLLAQGLTAQSYIWRAGQDGWKRAIELPELASLLAAVPPSPQS